MGKGKGKKDGMKRSDVLINIDEIISILKKETKKYRDPSVTMIAFGETKERPFNVLISCILSLRTKDKTTIAAYSRLNRIAKTPEELAVLAIPEIEKAIYPVGFYKTKAARIKEIAKQLVDKYDSKVPDDLDELLKFKGVGRKTANLVLTQGYGKLGICVDVHVNRISNRLGIVKTRNPHETESALREKLPTKYWIIYNDLLVMWGQNVCVPVSPFCSKCAISRYCPKINVIKSR
jgi:endonuclease-3